MVHSHTRDLTWARIAEFDKMTPQEKARRRMEDYNRSPGNLDAGEYDCPKCLNRGHFMRLREDLSNYVEACSCHAIRKSIWSAKNAGIYDRLLRHDFPSFQVREKWEQDMKQLAKDWAIHGQDQWLLLCGQSGCGKTHLTLAAVGYRIFHRGQSVTFLDWRKFNTLRETRSEEFYSLLKKAEAAQILFIDDLLKLEKTRTFHPAQELELAFQMLNHRVNQAAVTVISTELTPEQLLQMDEATGSRILHMTKQFKHTVSTDPRKNHRLRREPTEGSTKNLPSGEGGSPKG